MRLRGLMGAVLVCTIAVATSAFAANTYVGVKKCATCHKVAAFGGLAYTVWEKSGHAKAFETLKSKEADEIAKKKGLATAADASPECLKCHVTSVKEEGVTCEGCHGPASAYLNVHNKKTPDSKDKAIAAGLVIGDSVKKVCVTCHNAESPTHKEFKFDVMWAKIKHQGPEKKQ